MTTKPHIHEIYRGYDLTAWEGGWVVTKNGEKCASGEYKGSDAKNMEIAQTAVDQLKKKERPV